MIFLDTHSLKIHNELDQEIAKAQEMVKNAGDNKNKQRYAMKKLEKANSAT